MQNSQIYQKLWNNQNDYCKDNFCFDPTPNMLPNLYFYLPVLLIFSTSICQPDLYLFRIYISIAFLTELADDIVCKGEVVIKFSGESEC